MISWNGNEYQIYFLFISKMKKTYEELVCENNRLRKELDDLKYEYQENTIVQSMNDMKRRYDKLLDTTVPIEEYKRVESRNVSNENKLIAARVFIDKIVNDLRIYEQEHMRTEMDIYNNYKIYRIQLKLIFLKDVLELTM